MASDCKSLLLDSAISQVHLELAQVDNDLDILHCVMFPNPEYTLPIFGTNLIGSSGKISAAIADLSPVTRDRALPSRYQNALSVLSELQFLQPRALPESGDIFSDFCLFVR